MASLSTRSTFCAWLRVNRVTSEASATIPEIRGETSSTSKLDAGDDRREPGIDIGHASLHGRGRAAHLEKKGDRNNRLHNHRKRRHDHEKRHPAFHAFTSTRLLRFGFLPLISFAAGIDCRGNIFFLADCGALASLH